MFRVFILPEKRHREGLQLHQNKKYHVSRILIWLPPRCRIYYSETCSMDRGKEWVEISLHEWAEQPSDLLPPGSKASAHTIVTLLASTKWCHWGLALALSPWPFHPHLPGLPYGSLDLISSTASAGPWQPTTWNVSCWSLTSSKRQYLVTSTL